MLPIDDEAQQRLMASARQNAALAFSWLYIRNLKRTNTKVRLANETKTRFVQNMSHEIRTPLNAIVGFSQLNDFHQGTGLGLSICRDIAGRMGGRVYLDTSYKAGARFVFTVPVKPIE